MVNIAESLHQSLQNRQCKFLSCFHVWTRAVPHILLQVALLTKLHNNIHIVGCLAHLKTFYDVIVVDSCQSLQFVAD